MASTIASDTPSCPTTCRLRQRYQTQSSTGPSSFRPRWLAADFHLSSPHWFPPPEELSWTPGLVGAAASMCCSPTPAPSSSHLPQTPRPQGTPLRCRRSFVRKARKGWIDMYPNMAASSSKWVTTHTQMSMRTPCPLWRSLCCSPLPPTGLGFGHLVDDDAFLPKSFLLP